MLGDIAQVAKGMLSVQSCMKMNIKVISSLDAVIVIALQNFQSQECNKQLIKEEICTRIEVAYEQLGKVHTELCRQCTDRNDNELIYDIQDILNAILKVEVKLGMLKSEEEL